MSFETVFERWLQKQVKEEGGREEEPAQEDAAIGEMEEDGVEEEMPVIQREAWREEDMEGMPVLQKMVDLPSEERKLGSPPPPPLQITLSLTESYKKERQKHSSKSKSASEVKDKSVNTRGSNGSIYESYPVLQDIPPLVRSRTPRVQAKGEQTESIQKMSYQSQETQDVNPKEKSLHQCQGKSALTELTRLNHITSPVVARGSEMDAVRSPEGDLPMEPDSTSEFVMGSGRWLRSRKGSEASRGEVSPWREVSPRSTGCVGLRTPSGSEVMVRIEESPAECDSTSMFMNSPNAISPASQGEIEERVCPVLADHEDSASPSHFVCRCRSLPPPSDLMHRDQTHVAINTTSQLTVNVTGTISCQSKCKSWTPLVSRTHSLDDDPAPDLEKVAPSLDLMATPGDRVQSDHDISPPVLTLPEQEARVKQFSVEHSSVKNMSSEVSPREAPPLIRYELEHPQASGDDISTFTKYSDSPPVLSSNDFDSQDKSHGSPPLLSLHGQDVSPRPIETKIRQADVCDFTSNIDWETAVAETVESPPSLTKYDSEGKPGIIIKIRTKGRSTAPSVQLASKPELDPETVPKKQKRHSTIDNAEILSRLRKRRKADSETSAVEKEEVQAHTCGRKGMGTQPKPTAANGQSSVSHPRLKEKKSRRNTVQLDGDLKASTQGLCLKEGVFVRSALELSRLQTLTHELLCVLFPHLQPHLVHVAPESRAFIGIIDDIVLSLERSTSEESVQECEDVTTLLRKLSLKDEQFVPVFSPRVVLCSSPAHEVEELRGKLCAVFQLLLPDLTLSLTQTLSHSTEKLETFLKTMMAANKAKVEKKAHLVL